VLETLKADPARLRVVYEAAGEEFAPRPDEEVRALRRKYGLEGPYVLYVGTLNKRKNVPAMIRAFAIAREKARSDAVLAIAGRVGYGGETIREAIAAAGPGAEGFVKLLGYVPNSELAPLYGGAWGLLFATLYEGFGIPVVEAFSCGCPVIGGTIGSVPEIAGGAALLADPKNVGEIAAQVGRLLTDEPLRGELRGKGFARAKEFSWEKTAEKTLAVYREVV
jgi:glycosyltransferase involved in cell wall biosynthesis